MCVDAFGAGALARWRVIVRESELPAPAEDEFYVRQVVGLEACVDGRPVGRVVGVHPSGPLDVFELELHDGGVVFVPSLHEYLLEVDVAGGRVVMAASVLEVPE